MAQHSQSITMASAIDRDLMLHSLTVRDPGAITDCAYGSFTSPGRNEFATLRGGTVLEISRSDALNRLVPVCKVQLFALGRCIRPARLIGTKQDYVVLTSDSGRLTVFGWDAKRATMQQVRNLNVLPIMHGCGQLGEWRLPYMLPRQCGGLDHVPARAAASTHVRPHSRITSIPNVRRCIASPWATAEQAASPRGSTWPWTLSGGR